MRPQARDTDPKIEDMIFEGYRRMSFEEKVNAMLDGIEFIRAMQREEIRRAHPDADEREVNLRLASRWCNHELLKKGFGWDVEEQGY